MFRILILTLLLLGMDACSAEPEANGFALTHLRIPQAAIFAGGPPRDGIPALNQPELLNAQDADYLHPDDRILGLVLHGVARAYPIRLMNWHELVNDRLDGQPVLISYCPLCGTGMAFSARLQGETRHFGVSGLLYDSDVLMYDKETESLWSQLRMKAVSGPSAGQRLQPLPLQVSDWQHWRKAHPDSKVLSLHTGYRRNYNRDPYRGYGSRSGLLFPVAHEDPRLPKKTWVLGFSQGTTSIAWPLRYLTQHAPLSFQLANQTFRVQRNNSQAWEVQDEHGTLLPSVQAYWFAWAAFHPDTALHSSN